MRVEYVLEWKSPTRGWVSLEKSETDEFSHSIEVSEIAGNTWRVVRREITVNETVVRESQ